MRAHVAGVASMVIAGALVHCSLVVDTDGLSGGSSEAGLHLSDGPINGDGSVTNDAPAFFDAPVGPGGLGPNWLAYGNNAGRVAVRTWTGDAWSAELAGPNADGESVRWVIAKETPIGSFLAIESQGKVSPRLQVFQRKPDGTWALGFAQPMTVVNRRAFDIEYETKSNAVIVAYGDSTARVKSRRLVGGTWSDQVEIGAGGSLHPEWIELSRSPISDEVALVYADGGINLLASYWDGSNWQKPSFLSGALNTLDWKCFDQAYESSTGKLVVGWGEIKPVSGSDPVMTLSYAFRQPGAPVFGGTLTTAEGAPPGSMVMVPELGTKRIALSYVEYNCNRQDKTCDDFSGLIWDGAQFDLKKIDPETTTLFGDRPSATLTGVAWLGTTGEAISAYYRTLPDSPGQLAYSRFAGTWSDPKGAAAPPNMEPRTSLQLVSVPGSKVVAVVEDNTGALWSKVYVEGADGAGTWSDPANAPLVTALVPTNAVPFSATGP